MTEDTTTTTAAPLDYAPAASVVRSRWFRRTVILSLLLATFIGAWRFGGPLGHHARVLWWQDTCMEYRQPPDRLVYTNVADDLTQLLRTGEYLRHYTGGPLMFRDLPAYQGLSSEIGYQAGSGGAIAFMHERVNELGQRRLVIIYVSRDPALYASVLIPSTMTAHGKWGQTANWQPFTSGLHVGHRVFAGQVDLNDASSFTVQCEAGGVPRHHPRKARGRHGPVQRRVALSNNRRLRA